jgi:aminoglycoside 6'-N-acetyltransferase I
MEEAEKWFVGKGVSEIGSDAVVDNVISQKFHEKMGFEKGETIVHYIKKI